jgi:D-alanine-D-alanine ligase
LKIYIAYDAADYVSKSDFADSHGAMLNALRETHVVTHTGVSKENLLEVVTEIAKQNTDAVVNLCRTGQHRSALGQMVRQSLDSLNIACTGADYDTCSLHGVPLKMLAHSHGIAIPPFVMIKDADALQTHTAHLTAPYRLTTCPHLVNVAAMSATVNDRVALAQHASAMLNPSLNTLLVEEAIDGRSFDVLVAGKAHPERPLIAFRPLNASREASADWAWETRSSIEMSTRNALNDAAITLFNGMPDSGYLLCRLIVGEQRKVTLTDVECNADIFSTSSPDGTHGWQSATSEISDFRKMLLDQIDISIARRIKQANPIEIRFDPASGFGLYAATYLPKGTIVVANEGGSHRLISNVHVAQHWSAQERTVFGQYAWPMNTRVSVVWSDKPNQWKPQNHSCDPNTWLTGLNQVARRDIKRGDAITLDYATFCGPLSNAFTCLCSTPSCRMTVTGTDYRLPALRQAYNGHFTAHLTALIESDARQAPFAMRRTRYGGGITSRDAWKKHDILSGLTLTDFSAERTRWTVQIGLALHAEMRPAEIGYINHSCAPNVELDLVANVVRALRNIAPGDDLGWFYPCSEWQMSESFHCECGAAACIGLVNGAENIAKEVLAKFQLSSFVEERLAEREQHAAQVLVPA